MQIVQEVHYGALALIPPLIILLVALWLRTSFESLLLGCLSGFIIVAIHNGGNFFNDFIETTYKVLEDQGTIWVVLVCCLYGSLIALMVKSGGAVKFGADMLRFIKTKRGALLGAWALGMLIFIDDYLSTLSTGVAMKKITDHFKISRHYLAYIANATAVPGCVIVPLSTWTIFIGAQLEKSHFAKPGYGGQVYLSVIPYVAYGWVAVLIVPLVIIGAVPLSKKMRYLQLIAADNAVSSPHLHEAILEPDDMATLKRKPQSLFFILPLVVTLCCTFFMGYDALKGIIAGLAFTIIYYLVMRVDGLRELTNTVFQGINSMIYAVSLVVFSYIFKEIGDKMGLTTYVIDGVRPFINRDTLPIVIFAALSVITYITAGAWGVYAVMLPIVITLAVTLHANVLLNIGAVISAGVFGTNACFYSDSTILTAQSTDVNNVEHAFSQVPYTMVAFMLSAAIYGVLGFTIG